MENKIYTGKTKEEAISNALIDLNAKQDEVIIIEKEAKKTLFNKKVEIIAITKSELNKEIKDFLYKLSTAIIMLRYLIFPQKSSTITV